MKTWLAGCLVLLLSINVFADSGQEVIVEALKIARDEFYQDVSKSQSGLLSEDDLFGRVSKRMVPLINFEKIALRVMGKHRKIASTAEQERFIGVLTNSALNAYAKGLGGYEGEKLEIPDQVVLISPKRAVLDCVLNRPAGDALPVQFSLGMTQSNSWLIENVTIAGVNLGLLLRDQFNSLVQSTGSVSGAIDSWSFESVSAN